MKPFAQSPRSPSMRWGSGTRTSPRPATTKSARSSRRPGKPTKEKRSMPRITDSDLAIEIRLAALPLTGIAANYDPLIGMVGDAQFVLLGEASHGTHEFYRERAQITQ